MHQQSQYIIFRCKCSHIVAECSNMNGNSIACKHSNYRIFQPIHIHLNINFQSLVCFRLVPVGSKFVTQHCLYNGFWTVHGIYFISCLPMRDQLITIVPHLCFFETHIIFFTKSEYFLLCETKIFRQITRIGHGILGKHI